MSQNTAAFESIELQYTDCLEQAHHTCLWPSIVGLLPRVERMQILDAGCGSGFLSKKLAELGHEVTAIDISESGVARIRETYPEIHAEVRSVYDNLEEIVPDGGFDLVLSSEVIEHLYAPHDFLLNIARTIRVNGWIILTTPYHGYLKNLAISLVNGWDSHHSVEWEGGHIKVLLAANVERDAHACGFFGAHFSQCGSTPLFVEVHGRACPLRADLTYATWIVD